MEIPTQVIEAAQDRADCGGHLELRCNYNGEDVYSYVYEEPMFIGLPEFYIWNGEECNIVSGYDAEMLLLNLLKESLL